MCIRTQPVEKWTNVHYRNDNQQKEQCIYSVHQTHKEDHILMDVVLFYLSTREELIVGRLGVEFFFFLFFILDCPFD